MSEIWANSEIHRRTIGPSVTPRRKCRCGCETRAKFTGFANGVAMMDGCEMRVRLWVRDGSRLFTRQRRIALAPSQEGTANKGARDE